MKIRSKTLKRWLGSPSFGAILYRAIRAYSGTFRFRVENEAVWMRFLEQGGRVLLCTWHQQFFSAIRYFKNYSRYAPGLMISQSRDGDVIAAVAARSGWDPVRGSSSRQGREALAGMIRKLVDTRLAGHVLDGPRGPAGVVKPGVIRLAHAADAMIVPFYVDADRAWYLKSWDRFMLPKPFARVTLRYGDPLRFSPTDDSAEFERQRLELETVMRPGLHT